MHLPELDVWRLRLRASIVKRDKNAKSTYDKKRYAALTPEQKYAKRAAEKAYYHAHPERKERLNAMSKKRRAERIALSHLKGEPPEHVTYYAKNKEAHALRVLQSKYGVPPEKSKTLLSIAQNGVCTTCGGRPKKIRMHLDHNHKTNKVREVLCSRCNQVTGAIEDSRFSTSLAYVIAHAEAPQLEGIEHVLHTALFACRARRVQLPQPTLPDDLSILGSVDAAIRKQEKK